LTAAVLRDDDIGCAEIGKKMHARTHRAQGKKYKKSIFFPLAKQATAFSLFLARTHSNNNME
jgi:hypothetical protein